MNAVATYLPSGDVASDLIVFEQESLHPVNPSNATMMMRNRMPLEAANEKKLTDSRGRGCVPPGQSDAPADVRWSEGFGDVEFMASVPADRGRSDDAWQPTQASKRRA